MNFSLEHKDNLAIFTLKNTKLTSEISAQLKAKLLIIAQPDIEGLLIDLSSVEYCDSSGIGALLLANRQMGEYGLPVLLCGLQESVLQLLQLTRTSELFEIYDSVEEAINTFTETEE